MNDYEAREDSVNPDSDSNPFGPVAPVDPSDMADLWPALERPGVRKPDLQFAPDELEKSSPRETRVCPDTPGCYAWIANETKEVLRVGRAVMLRNRLRTYWIASDRSSAVLEMIDTAWWEPEGSIPWLVVWLMPKNETAAFEQSLIDAYRPRFNIHGMR